MGIEISLKKETLDAAHEAVSAIKNGYSNVLVTAINATITTMNVQVKARIGNELNLKASRIAQDLTLKKASYDDPNGSIVATGSPVGLINFGANQTNTGVTVKVKRSSARSLLKHAFIAKDHVWWRDRDGIPEPKKFATGKKTKVNWNKIPHNIKFPVYRLTGPRIEDILGQDKVIDPITTQANTLLLSNVGKKVDDLLRRHNG